MSGRAEHAREALERWASALRAVERWELRDGNATVLDQPGGELPARVAELFTVTALDFVQGYGKAVIFRVVALGPEGKPLGFMPLRVLPAASTEPPAIERGDLGEALKLELTHNRELVKALIEQSRSITEAHAKLGAIALERAQQETRRADSAEDMAREAFDAAEKAVTKAEQLKTQQGGDPTEALVREVIGATVLRQLGMPPEMVTQVMIGRGMPPKLAATVATEKAPQTPPAGAAGPAQGNGAAS